MITTGKMEERVLLVDENNKPIGSELRSVMRKNNLFHRSSFIYIYNSKYDTNIQLDYRKQFYVQKRTMTKDYLPGYYDLATGGVVQEHEGNLENAIRELYEEMGIKTDSLIPHKKNLCFVSDRTKVYGNLFSLKYDG